jgi:hypothetical protein
LLDLREGLRLNVSEKNDLRRVFGLNNDWVQESGESNIMKSLMICKPHQILFG